QLCHRCRLGWVEEPYTLPPYQRCGECPGLSWHTLGGHFRDSRAFWDAVGADVPGSYQQRPLCPHAQAGG
ncbi:MAG: hypothetical protein ACRDTX_31845, partial [Pseudonocardiaceae bacterium]